VKTLNPRRANYLVLGSGIVGLAIARKLQTEYPTHNVLIVEKDSVVGKHASSRNSGVIHSGIYYRTDSQKAKFCVEGNVLLKQKLRDLEIPFLKTGKLLVAKDSSEVRILESLLERAKNNGVNASLHPAEEISRFQPGAKTFETFLRIEDTAIADPKILIQRLAEEFVAEGGIIQVGRKAVLSIKESRVLVNGQEVDLVINSAGAGAIELSGQIGIARNLRLIPFLGLYFGSRKLNEIVKMPIYPVPNPVNPFLGVHLTPTIGGLTKIGPTAIPVLGREQYTWRSGASLSDILGSTRALAAMAIKQPRAFWDLATNELPRLLRPNVLKEASELHEAVEAIDDWETLPAGIRAQLINLDDGKLVDDFIVETQENSIHILNAVSPGWTSALSFAKWLVETHVKGKY
jgi:(S)-2-hydroxyglutarate dehydrogenase